VLAKSCSFCKWWCQTHLEGDGDPPEHECVKNHNGTSGSMEPIAALQTYIDLYNNKQVKIGDVITDDDSSMKAKLK